MYRCPGSDLRNITANEIPCRECGAAVELFSDEKRRKCPACGASVAVDVAPACASWCSAARECLGAERYEKLRESGAFDADREGDGAP